jgi:hypothetical protein
VVRIFLRSAGKPGIDRRADRRRPTHGRPKEPKPGDANAQTSASTPSAPTVALSLHGVPHNFEDLTPTYIKSRAYAWPRSHLTASKQARKGRARRKGAVSLVRLEVRLWDSGAIGSTAGTGGLCSLMSQGRGSFPDVDAFGCLRSLRARSALDGVSWVQGG